MDLTKLQPFGLTCWVHQKKQICDLGYGGKSDKKLQARQGILVGYNDQMGPLRAKVYFKDTAKTDWYAEELLEYRDPLYKLKLKSEHVPIIECEPKEIEYFEPFILSAQNISNCRLLTFVFVGTRTFARLLKNIIFFT